MYMSEKIKRTMLQPDKTLQSLLLLFDRYVLKEKNGKFQFSGSTGRRIGDRNRRIPDNDSQIHVESERAGQQNSRKMNVTT